LAKNAKATHIFHTSLQMGEKAEEKPEGGIFYKSGKYCKKKKSAELDNIENLYRGDA